MFLQPCYLIYVYYGVPQSPVPILPHLLEWLSSERQQIINVGKDVEKRERGILLVAMYIGTAIMENSMKIPQKTKNRTTIPPFDLPNELGIHLLGTLSEGGEIVNLKRCFDSHILYSIICNS